LSEAQRVTLTTNLRAPIRREVLMGRSYIVAPATLVRSQILNNNLGRTFLPAEDITASWAEASNGSPAVADHPNVSARSPEVLNRLGVGIVLNARVADGALKADVYLDPARAGDVPDLRAILAKLETGQAVEVSTGFAVMVDETPGVHNGESYDVVIHPLSGLDHLAVFADAIGACSVVDGCGLAANHAGPCDPEKTMDEGTQGKFAQAVDRLLAFLSRTNEEPPAAEPVAEPTLEEGTMNREQMIAQLAEAGPLDRDALNKLSDCQLKALSGSVEPPAPATPEIAELQNRIVELRREKDALEASTTHARQAEMKERLKLQEDLIYNGRTQFSDDQIRGMDIAMLRQLHGTVFRKVDYSALGGPAAVNTGTGSFDFVQGVMDGPRGSSVLDKKEAN
jgi:hypothetical protein